MKHYPIFLDLRDRPVLVVGAGKTALRKARGLVDAGARVTVVAPEAEPEFAALEVRFIERRFRATDLNGMMLVFAATDDRLTNHRVAIAAKGRGLFANIADSGEECDFVTPIRVQRGGSQAALYTKAAGVRIPAEVRRTIEELLDEIG